MYAIFHNNKKKKAKGPKERLQIVAGLSFEGEILGNFHFHVNKIITIH